MSLPRPDDRDAIEAAIHLGNGSRATLGHMPFSAYYAAATNATLLLAHAEDQVAGYALFGLARRRVRLAHLCVGPAFRGQGIARLLVEELSRRHADYLGIAARCKRRYNLGGMWINLGFTQIGERPGRGKDAEPLVDWWRDHRHPNLFTADADNVLVRAAIDVNVLRDLAEPGRPDSDEARALLADHLVGLLESVRTAALDAEIDRMEGPLRVQCTQRAQPFIAVRGNSTRLAEIAEELRAAAQRFDPQYPRDHQDRFDLQHVADTIASDLNVLVTRDGRLAEIFGSVAQRYGVRIMRPADVIIHIDELVHAESYRPVNLLDTGYLERLIGSGQDHDVITLANVARGERPRALQKMVRDLALAGAERVGVYHPSRGISAAYGIQRTSGALRVPLLRVVNHALGDTLARQLLFRIRQQARDDNCSVIRLHDPYMSPQVRLAALSDGFREDTDGDLYVYTLSAIGSASQIEHIAALAARQAGLPEPTPLRSSMPAVAAAELERIWWPAKILDSELPTYLIPIQQAFSADLLGVPTGILPRNEALGLNREHVYYRRPGGTKPQAPARLLWYMSEGGSTVPHPPGIIACSQLDGVITASPEELYDRFQHLGVWDKATVINASRDGQAQALRFTNTEVFPHAVPRDRFRKLARDHGTSGKAPQGPLRIPPGLFAALYQEGRTL